MNNTGAYVSKDMPYRSSYNLSAESNQKVESKRKSVELRKKSGVQLQSTNSVIFLDQHTL